MILITIKENGPPRNLHQVGDFHTIYLGIATDDLEVWYSGMLYTVGNSQLKLGLHVIMNLCVFIDYFQFIVVGIIIRYFLESPVIALGERLQCANKFQFQFTVLSCTILCNCSHRTFNAFPRLCAANQLSKQHLSLFSAE